MADIIKFKPKIPAPAKPGEQPKFERIEGPGWVSYAAMLEHALADIILDRLPCCGMAIIMYDPDMTTIYRRTLSPCEVLSIAQQLVDEHPDPTAL
jgi:hypothetical protein